MEFHEKSYKAHAYKTIDKEKFQTWSREDTVDYWRHKRMYDLLLPFLENYKDAKWLTVGDGRYGTDAHYLSKYTNHVLATDINETNLKVAKQDGFIKDYKIENAEDLSFEDATFDFVFCKESYHHFPRPAIALYEMLRVAKKAVFVIEPNDLNIPTPASNLIASLSGFWLGIKNVIKKSFGKGVYYEYGNYEPSGNYVYTVSKREFEKIALGINLPCLVTKGLNDHYIEGVEFEKAAENGPLMHSIKKNIQVLDNQSKRGLIQPSLLFLALFKVKLSDDLSKKLVKDEYDVINLPRNPYLDG